jgi:hypothetical protein
MTVKESRSAGVTFLDYARARNRTEEISDDVGLDQRCSVRTPRWEVVADNVSEISERRRCLMTWD